MKTAGPFPTLHQVGCLQGWGWGYRMTHSLTQLEAGSLTEAIGQNINMWPLCVA